MSTLQRANNEFDSGFIINEMNGRNKRATNLIRYNVTESDSYQSGAHIDYDRSQVNTVLHAIFADPYYSVSIKVIRLRRYQSNESIDRV